jgi:hypothetical protein
MLHKTKYRHVEPVYRQAGVSEISPYADETWGFLAHTSLEMTPYFLFSVTSLK